MNTIPPKAGRDGAASPDQAHKPTTHHVFGTLEDLSLWHDPADQAQRITEMGMICPKSSDSPDSECTRVM